MSTTTPVSPEMVIIADGTQFTNLNEHHNHHSFVQIYYFTVAAGQCLSCTYIYLDTMYRSLFVASNLYVAAAPVREFSQNYVFM